METRHKYGPGDTKCEPCAVNEIDADAFTRVSGEPWCKSCFDLNATLCDRCNDAIDVEDADNGHEDENCCHDCAHS